MRKAVINKTDLTNFLIINCLESQGVNCDEVDYFLKQYDINLRSDHRNFLIKYANNTSLLTSMFADCTFEQFKKYYSAYLFSDELHDDEKIPFGTSYFGHDFNDEFLCIDHNTGEIFVYGYEEKSSPAYYKNIDSFLVYSFFWHQENEQYFEIVEKEIQIQEQNKFKSNYGKNEVKDLCGYCFQCYIKDQELYIADFSRGYYSLYKGGILNLLNRAII